MDIQQILNDPGSLQADIIELIEKKLPGSNEINDVSTPFATLIEAAVITGHNSVLEPIKALKAIYPTQVSDRGGLYSHMSEEELMDLHAVPSEGTFTFKVSTHTLKEYGNRPANSNYVETVIPEDTHIIVNDTTFTLLNDIRIRLFDNGRAFVEQLLNDNPYAMNGIGVLPSAITLDNDGNEWIIMETVLKQIKKVTMSDVATASGTFNLLFKEKDFFTFSRTHKITAGGLRTEIPQTHCMELVSTDRPGVIITYDKSGVDFTIPSIFLINESISGNVEVEAYFTKGKIFLPLNRLDHTNFKVVLGNTSKNTVTATSLKLNILVESRAVIDSGVDSTSTEDLKTNIVNNTTGKIDNPVNSNGLEVLGKTKGYEITKATDIVMKRIFVGSKIPLFESEINTNGNVLLNTAKLLNSEIDNSNVLITHDTVLLRAGTVFKSVNDVCVPISLYDEGVIANLNNKMRSQYYKDHKLFSIIFDYMIKKTDDVVESHPFILNEPKMSDLKIISKTTRGISVNTMAYDLKRTPVGYKIYVKIEGDTTFTGLDPANLVFRLYFKIKDNATEEAFFSGIYNPAEKMIVYEVKFDGLVNESSFKPTNGMSSLQTYNILLSSVVRQTIHDSNADDLLVEESIKVTFGTELKYLWNKVVATRNERVYKKYEADVPRYHEEIEYDRHPETGAIYDKVNGEIVYRIKHNVGDPYLDSNGNPVLKHVKGTEILDTNGLPIVDQDAGILRITDLLMVEHEFFNNNSEKLTSWQNTFKDSLKYYIETEIPALNENLLDETKILFRPNRSVNKLAVKSNGKERLVNPYITPIVKLYKNVTGDLTQIEITNLRRVIGDVLVECISGLRINVNAIEERILKAVGDTFVGARVTTSNFGTGTSIVSLDEGSKNRFMLNKVLEEDGQGDLIPRYDIEIEIETI